MERIDFELAAFGIGAMLGRGKRHPSMWGIYEDGFEIETYMQWYALQRRRIQIGERRGG